MPDRDDPGPPPFTGPLNRRGALRLLAAGIVGLSPIVRFAGGLTGLPSLARGGRWPDRSSAPNILFIMTDDQRQDAMSAYGNMILKTPSMDRIAAEGIRFT